MPSEDPMDAATVADKLNAALRLQYRSASQYALTAGGLVGMQYHGLMALLWDYAQAELRDLRLLVEKIVALGGTPTVEVAPLCWEENPHEAVHWLIESEKEAISALHQVIPATGQEPRSEALEHLMEHLIMRKQEQVDLLTRATRRGG